MADEAPRGRDERSGPGMSYSDYILRTGGRLAAWEDAFGSYLLESRFAGL